MKNVSLKVAALVICSLVAGSLWAQDGEGQSASESPEPPFRQVVYRDLAAWRHVKAKALLEENQSSQAKSAGYDVAWAVMLAQERKLDKAVQQLTQAVRKNPSDPSAPYFLGEIHSWRKETEAADEAWKKARDRAKAMVKEDKKDGWALYWQGAALIRLGDFSKAESQLRKALKNGADPAMAEFQLGLAQVYLKKWDPARQAFTRCLEVDSGFSHAYYFRGRVWQELGKTEEMLLDMDRFLTLAPDAREANAAKSILRAGG